MNQPRVIKIGSVREIDFVLPDLHTTANEVEFLKLLQKIKDTYLSEAEKTFPQIFSLITLQETEGILNEHLYADLMGVFANKETNAKVVEQYIDISMRLHEVIVLREVFLRSQGYK